MTTPLAFHNLAVMSSTAPPSVVMMLQRYVKDLVFITLLPSYCILCGCFIFSDMTSVLLKLIFSQMLLSLCCSFDELSCICASRKGYLHSQDYPESDPEGLMTLHKKRDDITTLFNSRFHKKSCIWCFAYYAFELKSRNFQLTQLSWMVFQNAFRSSINFSLRSINSFSLPLFLWLPIEIGNLLVLLYMKEWTRGTSSPLPSPRQPPCTLLTPFILPHLLFPTIIPTSDFFSLQVPHPFNHHSPSPPPPFPILSTNDPIPCIPIPPVHPLI